MHRYGRASPANAPLNCWLLSLVANGVVQCHSGRAPRFAVATCANKETIAWCLCTHPTNLKMFSEKISHSTGSGREIAGPAASHYRRSWSPSTGLGGIARRHLLLTQQWACAKQGGVVLIPRVNSPVPIYHVVWIGKRTTCIVGTAYASIATA